MNQPHSLVQVFNRYLQKGGEEASVERIHAHVGRRHPVTRCFFDSATWTGPGAPGRLRQAACFFYNPGSARRLEETVRQSCAEAALFHNIYPVGSPSLYRSALRQDLPVIQYLHNYRPFSVGGSLFHDGRVSTAPLSGDYAGEVAAGVWQGRARSFLCALMLKLLHRSGWLESVSSWVCISQFMADRLAEHGCVPAGRLQVLRHSWDAMPAPPPPQDRGHYLFLGRLIPEKGLATLIQAWHELRGQLGLRTPELHIAGEGPLEPLVRQAAADNPCIRHLGQVGGSTKTEALQGCRALVAPSVWWEPLGLMVYEAYDHGKPVLAARSGGLGETVLQDETGLLHEPGDVAGLVRDVLALEAMTAEQRQAMGGRGRDWLLREAAVSLWQDRFDAILEQALMEHRRPS